MKRNNDLMARGKEKKVKAITKSHGHKDAETLLRPDAGLQTQFKKKRPPKIYRHGPSELSWDT
jgi:hypothetical protein